MRLDERPLRVRVLSAGFPGAFFMTFLGTLVHGTTGIPPNLEYAR
jgi:hypothetical protein